MEEKFKLVSKFSPTGDQPKAIEKLTEGIESSMKHQTLLGVTGSGKTYSIAHVIANINKPTLILAHNKTLAAQLAAEYKEFFPENSVQYFVSYYDYYQPEAYVPKTDTFIEKETQINEEIEKFRNAATQALLTRKDVIIVASVSCIYGLGDPEDYNSLARKVEVNKSYQRDKLLRHLTDLQYNRNDIDFHRGTFRVKGDTVDIFPSYEDRAIRIKYFGDEIEEIFQFDPLTGGIVQRFKEIIIFPAKHYVTSQEKLVNAMGAIREELKERVEYFKSHDKLLEAQRIEQRTNFDLEMIEHTGMCSGIENYSRHIDGRAPGSPPSTLLDYFLDDYLMVIDESHITIPQIRGMYGGDRSRKQTLVDFGFRLPSAMDNRPLRFEEFSQRLNQVIYTSATPAPYELSLSIEQGQIVEQIIRPTGLLDPMVTVKPIKNQIDDLLEEINKTILKGQRVIVTTLTKRMAEDLTDYLLGIGIKVQYIHTDVDTIERTEILRDLRLGEFDVIVGINLLREGLDLPEVSLVAILDADKEGFLRSASALIQTMGRAARHVEGRVIMYADRITQSMQKAIDESNRRRKIQEEYNVKHGITPQSIKKDIRESLRKPEEESEKKDYTKLPKNELTKIIKNLEEQMEAYSDNLQFEKAAEIRDEIRELKLNAR